MMPLKGIKGNQLPGHILDFEIDWNKKRLLEQKLRKSTKNGMDAALDKYLKDSMKDSRTLKPVASEESIPSIMSDRVSTSDSVKVSKDQVSKEHYAVYTKAQKLKDTNVARINNFLDKSSSLSSADR